MVVVRDDREGVRYLCAYLVSENELPAAELREYLGKSLPEYMIPSYFIRLAKVPLTPNGKVDRKALADSSKWPELESGINTGRDYLAPTNEIEEKLVEIWREILHVTEIGINHNFFEMGGDSLKAMTLISKIHQIFTVKISVNEVFVNRTIQNLGEFINNSAKNDYSSIAPGPEMEYYPLTSAQKRMFFLNKLEGDSITYNISVSTIIEGNLDQERLEGVFQKLIKRHESLRTSFEIIGDVPVQKIHPIVDFKINYVEQSQTKIEQIVKKFMKPFNLTCAPLIRICLVKQATQKYLLICDLHHIISDGKSLEILIKEFVRLYNGEELPELKIQYKDFSILQNEILQKGVFKKQEEYWFNRFSDRFLVKYAY